MKCKASEAKIPWFPAFRASSKIFCFNLCCLSTSVDDFAFSFKPGELAACMRSDFGAGIAITLDEADDEPEGSVVDADEGEFDGERAEE